jgi:hypothetical protein
MEPLFLCIECGAAYAGERRGTKCPSCDVELIDMQMAQTDDRLRVLLSLADSRWLRRLEGHGMLGGAAVGAAIGIGLLQVFPGLAATLFAVPLLAALLVGLFGWLTVPLVVARMTMSRQRPLRLPAGRTKKKALALAGCVAAVAAIPVALTLGRVAAAPARLTLWNDGHPGWSRLTSSYVSEITPQIQKLATCAPPSCDGPCAPMSVVATVRPSGTVDSALVTPALEAVDCVRAQVLGWQLPAAPNDAWYLVEMPFVFSRGDDGVRVAHPLTAQSLTRPAPELHQP